MTKVLRLRLKVRRPNPAKVVMPHKLAQDAFVLHDLYHLTAVAFDLAVLERLDHVGLDGTAFLSPRRHQAFHGHESVPVGRDDRRTSWKCARRSARLESVNLGFDSTADLRM
eukprot:CAMPEP_0177386140 /NCGR_PEP_ID=MMETSP0368-20130122/50628_1 /TAXON_ID=447022 ORGANISM="Scrippsiella hangoei-like, Strain SHHI-4" /NCGR_SAMPLE_ID=MMETSP0368 /ASSEMBLY_ACC=CAM_ASM_000363 /LENGTH=111 /DNA_ID=CAMNT_0018850975 /DNA_START=117 /DNA_END=453 /DNA_ORIENTATION=+